MKNESKEKVSIQENLKDAGCNSTMINCFFELQVAGKITEQLQLLAKHRRELLNTVHEKQKKLDCLDHLIFEIKK